MLTGMDERSRVLLSSLLGAALGGVIGYLYLTDQGRKVRLEIEPTLDAIADELRRVRDTGDKVRHVADEGRATLDNLVGEHRARDWAPSDYRASS